METHGADQEKMLRKAPLVEFLGVNETAAACRTVVLLGLH